MPTAVNEPMLIGDDLRRAARERGWTDELIERAVRMRVPPGALRQWLSWSRQDEKRIVQMLDRIEQQTFGALRVREATFDDNEKYAELFLNSPEQIGEWQVTVERGPYAFAQFRLQETVSLRILEDRGVILGAMAMSWRNTLVAGRRLCVQAGQALRVRRECRGREYGRLVLNAPGAATLDRPSVAGCPHVRSQNFNAAGFFAHLMPDFFGGNPERAQDVPGVPVTVLSYPRRPFDGDPTGIRRARRADLGRCARLINRTHRRLDLFRPYTAAYLRDKLDGWAWGEKPAWWESVYAWGDYWVLEQDGRVVACAGLWDRGKHVREVWRHKGTGEARVVTATALLDFGHAEGREAEMARLIE